MVYRPYYVYFILSTNCLFAICLFGCLIYICCKIEVFCFEDFWHYYLSLLPYGCCISSWYQKVETTGKPLFNQPQSGLSRMESPHCSISGQQPFSQPSSVATTVTAQCNSRRRRIRKTAEHPP